MTREPKKTIEQVIAEVGRYPMEAYQFMREGLGYTVETVHGQEDAIERRIYKLMQERDLDLAELERMYQAGELDEQMTRYLKERGGPDAINRHVTGQELCWGLRELALRRWGLLARTVLKGWNITETTDFGRIVFALVENGFLRKEPQDKLEDFQDVYDFEVAFDQSFQLGSADHINSADE